MSAIFLNEVRLSFPSLKVPTSSYQNGPLKYRADLLMEPTSKNWIECQQEIMKLAQAKWGEHAQQALGSLERMKRSFGDGSERRKQKTMEVFEGYEGMKYVVATSNDKPKLIHPQTGEEITNDLEYQQLAGQLYGGCFVNAAIEFYIPKDPSKLGVFCGLVAIQFAKDGESFGGGRPDVSGMQWGKGAAMPAANASPAGAMPAPNADPFGQPQTPAAEDMPASPFPDFLR